MSIASEISRLQQAKSDLAASIENKGVTVPAATTIDGYAALVDQIQQGGTPLPYDAEIEYLESTGTQWINTGIKPSPNIVVTIDFVRTDNSTFSMLFGWRYYKSSPGRRVCFAFIPKLSSGNNYWQLEVGRDVVNSSTEIPLNTFSTVVMSYTSTKVTCGSSTKTVSHSGKVWDAEFEIGDMLLFSRGTISTDGSVPFIGKVYACTIKYSDLLVRDFIPVRVGQVGYMYDKISGTLFGNAGTGSFTLGADKN